MTDMPPPPSPPSTEPQYRPDYQAEYRPDHPADYQPEYRPPTAYGPPAAYTAPPSQTTLAPVGGSRRGSPLAAVIAVLGLGTAAAGLFALPLESYGYNRGGDYSYIQIRQYAALVGPHLSRFPHGRGTPFTSFAAFWWRFGLLTAGVLLVLLVCAAVAVATARTFGALLAAVAVAAGILQAVALSQSADAVATLRYDFPANTSMFDHAGPGIWVGFAGLALLAVAGAIFAVGRRRA